MKLYCRWITTFAIFATNLCYSADPFDNWFQPLSGTQESLNCVVYGHGKFVTVGNGGRILRSADGISWSICDSGTTQPLTGVVYGSNAFVVVGTSIILTSDNGITWTNQIGNAYTLKGVGYGNETYVTFGRGSPAGPSSDRIGTSMDGITWSWRNLSANHLRGICFVEGRFAAVGGQGVTQNDYFYNRAYYSVDGLAWVSENIFLAPSVDMNAVSFGGGLLVAVGYEGLIYRSIPHSGWMNQISHSTNALWGVTYDLGTFVVVGSRGETLTSSDGSSWTRHGSGTVNALRSVAYGNGHFVTVGDAGTILVSGQLESRSPWIINQPTNQGIVAGANVNFSVMANGTPPVSYQWLRNGVNIAAATNSTLTLNSVSAGDSDSYSVVVWNVYGSVVSETASLAVLTDGANGQQPTQITTPPSPPQPVGADSLVIVTHGWEPLGPFADISWITDMANAIQARAPANFVVIPFDWMGAAWFLDPDLTLISGANLGGLYAKLRLIPQRWHHVHLIGHSAGSAVIEAMAKELKLSPNPPVIHETFLDPYTSFTTLAGRDVYGANADWADNYSALNFFSDILPGAVGFGASTEGKLDNAFNVDVSWVNPVHVIPFGTAGQVAISTHGYPHDFYMKTITSSDSEWCGAGYGFALSKEKEGISWDSWAKYPPDNDPFPLCGPANTVQNPSPGLTSALLLITDLPYALSDFGASLLGNAGFLLSSISSQLSPQALVKQSGIKLQGRSTNSAATPSWLAVGVPVTNAVNFVQFDAGFTSTNVAEGLLTVYWNTDEIGIVDERVASPGLQTYRFALPALVKNGLYALNFRLDAFNNTSSSITVTNVATGFVGVTEPVMLNASLNTNGTPLVQLTGVPGYNYLLQSSTNLADWTPAALLVNTNGTVLFSDPAATNSSARFYRAVMPF